MLGENGNIYYYPLFSLFYQMVLPTTLKRRHSLKGGNILPIIKKLRQGDGNPKEYARVTAGRRTEDMALEDLKVHFENITGEDPREILRMAAKDYTLQEMRLLLHHTIIQANEAGQPRGQDLREVVSKCFCACFLQVVVCFVLQISIIIDPVYRDSFLGPAAELLGDSKISIYLVNLDYASIWDVHG